ncbi:MAG TPA: transketolase [Pseudomonadales bacterium]|nr:transketolase [Pseudomonadales bacterium]
MPSRRQLANAIRALSMDAVQKAKSGHPGAPMGMADIAEVLWRDHLKHNPSDPSWPDRDRFILSNGHGSMLLYSLLHLSGYELSIEDIKQFRQLHSKTAGHPEFGEAPGIETTTGPLGQGLANAVGMALAEKILAGQFNRPGFDLVDHHTYVFAGDGCLMEGISHEACSLAGTLGLGKLIVFYDDNGISIDGHVQGWFSDDTPKRFEAYHWQVIANVDGHDSAAIAKAIAAAKADTTRPTLICCKTIIGFGAPNKQGSHDVHGAPLGPEEIAAARVALDWPHPAFEIPEDIKTAWDARTAGATAQARWQEKFAAYTKAHPTLAAEFERRIAGLLPENWAQISAQCVTQAQAKAEKIASRKASQNCIEAFAPQLPELLGGSADLAGSNLTLWSGSKGVDAKDASGNYIYYGVREFAMVAIMNGLALHKGFIAYGGTFLVFMEYARNAMRMAALMKQQAIYVLTHDSIGLGEDGPTHQPVEQLANLRSTPNLYCWRPCDTVETAVAWKSAIENRHAPSALALSRQNLPVMERSPQTLALIEKGAYILHDCEGQPDVILIATGSEVAIAMAACKTLESKQQKVRVVSMPCMDLFAEQEVAYQQAVLPSEVEARVAIEAASIDSWYRYIGLKGKIIGMRSFGASAPIDDLYAYFGITAEAVVQAAESLL